MCIKSTNSNQNIKATTLFVVFLFVHSWEQRKFDEIAVRASTICSDANLPRVEYEDIVSGTGRLNKDIYAKQSSKSGIAFHQGDILYGKLRPYLQNWLLSTFDGLAVGDFWVLQPQNADSSFLYRLIQSRQFDEVANQSTGTKMPRADWKLVSKTVFYIPSNIREQAAIGTHFTALDNLITLHQREFFRLILAFFCCNSTSILPISWEQRKLGDCFIERNERSGDGEMISVTINSGIRKFDELNRHDTKPDDLSKYKRVEIGDIAYNSMRMWQGASGYSPYSGILSPAYTVITPKEGVSSRFFAYLIKRPKTIHLFEINSQGLTKDTWNLKFPAFAPIEVKAPVSYEEQVNISRILIQLDNLITLHQRECLPKTCSLASWFYQQTNRKMTSFWEQRKLGEVGKCQSGIGFPDVEQGGKIGTPFYKVSDMNNYGNEQEMTCANNYVTDEQIARKNWKPITEVPAVIFAKVGAAIMLNRKRLCSFSFLLDNNTMAYKFGEQWNTNFGKTLFEKIDLTELVQVGALPSYNATDVENLDINMPTDINEQKVIGDFFVNLDNLITLHQRIKINITGDYHDKKDK